MNTLDDLIRDKLKLPDEAVIYRKRCPEWDTKVTNFSFETRESLKIIQPDAIYHFNKQPFILFFDFTRKKDPKRLRDLQKQIWCFDKAPVVFFIFEDEVTIYNAFHYQKRYDQESGLEEIPFEKEEEKYSRFSFWELQSGNTWQWIQKTFYKEGKKNTRVNQKLFDNIKDICKKLTNNKLRPPLDDTFANILILRLIFIRYLIDRGVEIDERFIYGETLEERKQCLNELIANRQKLQSFFKYLGEERFNGNLFETKKDLPIEQTHLTELSLIFSAHRDQFFLFDVFDFSIIPVEVISGIYESVIDPEKREKDSAIYTPAFLVDDILSQTVDEFLKKQKTECKILDPACGSGIFLVQAYRKLVEKHRSTNNYISDKRLVELMQNNLFGIDKDMNALNVAAFSLYVALLDYKDSPEIKNFKLPDLLNTNLFKADFFDEDASFNFQDVFKEKQFDFILGNPPWGRNKKDKPHIDYIKKHNIPTANFEIAQTFLARTKDFANEHTTCALIVTSKAFYNVSAKKKEENLSLTEFSLNNLKQQNTPIEILDKLKNLQNQTYPTKKSFLKVLKATIGKELASRYQNLILKHTAQGFNYYFLTRFHVKFLFDLSAVRRLIFPEKDNPAMIVRYHYAFGRDTKDNIITHYSLKPNIFLKYFKSLVIEKQDQKQILQKYFIEYDWMFKVALYGNTIDFHFLKRILECQTSINDQIEQKPSIVIGDGILKGSPKPEPFTFLVGMPVIDHRQIRRYYSFVNTTKKLKLQDTYLESGRKLELFDGHHILLKAQTESESNLVVSYIDTPSVFRHDVFGITTNMEFDTLKLIYGLMISSLYTYYQYMTSSAWGVATRPAIRLPEYLSFPIEKIKDKAKFIALVDQIIAHYKSYLSQGIKFQDIPVPVELFRQLNKIVNTAYEVDNMEEDLIAYVLEVSRYQFQESKLDRLIRKPREEELIEYAKVFYNHFSNVYNEDGEYFQVNVYPMTYFVAMKFNIVTTPPSLDKTIDFPKHHYTEKTLLQSIAQTLSIYESSNSIFLQKDVKGFEEDFFYIIKPNEYKCWHRAIAHYDLAEFVEAIEKAELEQMTGLVDE